MELTNLGDDRGSLVVLENNKQVPFNIERVYYIYASEQGVSRGFHAHKELEQIAICVKGQCEMLLDNGQEKQTILLDSPTKAVTINKMVWHEMHNFSDDCVLLVLASDIYDESDYIRNYKAFIKAVNHDS
nr:FdtA/QdtA family cupin domain-containing protein [Pseudoalteromonas sp. ACER1]